MSEANNTLYPWKRFWCPWEKSISLADDGFVYDPESEYGIILNPDLTTLASTVELPCLILLGEPGLGKSQALREHHAELVSANDSSRRLMLVDLKEFGSDAALTRGLFESETFQQWKESKDRLYLFLDSFDEGLLTIEALSGYISRELRALTVGRPTLTADGESPKSADASVVHDGTDSSSSRVGNPKTRPIDRLYLRIVCRPAIWPSSLTADLRGIFSERAVSVWRLAPLRKADVELAAERKGVSGFVREVTSRGVVPFATKPLTLKALLNLYQSRQALPSSRYDIYEELCRVACVETSNSRRERQKAGHLTPQERLSVASRVAALMVFGNRGRLRTDLIIGDLADEELGIDAMFGYERQQNHKVVIDSQALAETLDTALFNWPKLHCATWDHRTYCEFLAARYCYVHRIPPKRLKKLVFTEAFGEKRVAPQLYETTAWLCSLYPSLRSDVLACDPFVLLISDVLREDFSIRHKATERYLESFEKERVFSDQIRDELRLLKHPHLAGQLRRYISQKTKKTGARLRAMDIAAECAVREVEPDLINVALDTLESVPVRTHALFTLGKYEASASRAMLRELVTRPRGDDKDQEIKGWTLIAIWPDNISASELFAVLTDSDTPGFVGGYASFLHKLSRDVPSILQEGDLETALDWVAKLNTDGDGANRLTAVADSVMLRAWHSLQNSAILDRFARIVLKRIEDHVPIALSDDVYRPGQRRQFNELLAKSTVNRRLLISSLVRHLAAGTVTFPPIRLMFTPDHIVRTDDTGWLIEQLESCTSEERTIIESLLNRMPDDFESLNAFRKASDEGRLPSEYGTKLYVESSSELAVRLRREYEEYQPRPRVPVLLVPSPRARLLELLERVKSGNLEAWSGLTRTLTLEDYSQYYGDEGDDVRKLPGWLAADTQIRREIVLAAQQFVLGYPPAAAEYSQQTFGHWIIAAYLAFALLHDESMSFLETRDEAFWNRWTGLLISYRFDNARGVDRQLLSLVAKNYPGALNVGLAEVLSPTLEDCYFLNKLSDAWVPQVEEHLMQMLQQGALKCRCCDVILSLLLEKGSTEAEDFVIAMVKLATDSDSQVRGAVALLKHAPRKSQDVVWPLIKASDMVGQRIIESVSDMGGNAKFVDSWSESTIGQLFVWMVKRYPYSQTDYRRGGAFAVGTADTVMYLRDALLTHLRGRGTAEAVEALRRAGKELNVDWMKWHIVEAKNAAFRREWKPAEPSYVLSLAADSESMTPAEVGYRSGAILALILNLLAGLMIPAQLSILERSCLMFGLALIALVSMEKANSKQSSLFPLYFILLLADIAAYLLLHFTMR